MFSVLAELEEMVCTSNWDAWMHTDASKQALCLRAFAHTITSRPVARVDNIPGADTTWSDAENLGFVALMVRGWQLVYAFVPSRLGVDCARQIQHIWWYCMPCRRYEGQRMHSPRCA